MRALAIIFIVLFVSETYGNDKYKIPVKEIKVGKDTVVNEVIKSLVDNDSVQILEYQKYVEEEIPEFINERIVYIDYRRKAEGKLTMLNFDRNLKNDIDSKNYYLVTEPIDGPVIENPLKELNKTYTSLNKLKNSYILFEPEINYRTVINDTAILFKDIEGWFICKFKSVQKEKDKFILELYNYNYYTYRIEIKIIDKKHNIQLWKMTRNQDGEISSFYDIVIPIENSFNYPMLNIINTGGLDDVYENFDDLNLEELFNN